MHDPTPSTKFEHRRKRLLELRAAVAHPFRYWFANAIGVPDDYLARLEYEPGKDQRKNLGDGLVTKLQDAFGLPPGWFDLPSGASIPRGIQIVSKDGRVEHSGPLPSATVLRMHDLDISAIGFEVGRKLSTLSEEQQKSLGAMILASIASIPPNTEAPPKPNARKRPRK